MGQMTKEAKKSRYKKENIQSAAAMAWPAIVESFFTAFAGLVDSLMVSSLGAYAVAAVGLTTQPKFIGLSLFFCPERVNLRLSGKAEGRK